MTEIIVKKRKTLSFNKTQEQRAENKLGRETLKLSKAKVELQKKAQPKRSSEELVRIKLEKQQNAKENDQQQAMVRQQKNQLCREWMLANFPKAFDYKNVKPLALGLQKELNNAHKAAGGIEKLGFGQALPVSRFLNHWTSRPAYLKSCLKDGAMRHNLQGEPVEPVSEKHIEHAKKELEKYNAQN